VNPVPDRAPDHEVHDRVQPNQALIYRPSGDRNPLHSDPAFARKAGFEQPTSMACAPTGSRVGPSSGRSVTTIPTASGGWPGVSPRPTLPGDELVVRIRELDHGAAFQTARADGTVVFDAGRFTFSWI
jgi:acyl dehydratase